MIGKVFLVNMKQISKNTRSPNKVREAMKHVMEGTNKMVHSLYIVDLLNTLKRKRIGTNSIEQLIKKLCGGGPGRETVLEVVLKNRLKGAYKNYRKLKYENQKIWRVQDEVLIEEGVLEAFLVVWAKEKMRYRQVLKEQRRRKVEWLLTKYQKRGDKLPEQYRGYSFKNQDIGDEFNTKAVAYGGVEITKEEEEALKMHPKYTIFEEIDTVKFMTEVEKSFTKIRWEVQHRGNKTAQNNNTIANKAEWNNMVENTIDMRKISATDLPFNSRVYLPNALDESMEVEMYMLKQKLKVIAEKYKGSNEKGIKNMTKQQMEGIKRLRERRRNGEVVIYQTDKSAKMAVDTTVNYIKSMEVHIEKDLIINEKDNRDIEKLINAHATCWIRFMQAGNETEDVYRIKMSMLSHNNAPACIYSLRKDHKACLEEHNMDEAGNRMEYKEGPPVRPVCDVSESISHRLSYLLSKIIEEICYGDTVCVSTEEMMASIAQCNEKGIGEDFVLGSADVKSLYPSIDVKDAVDVVCDEFDKAKFKMDGVDYEEMGLYLALNLEAEELDRAGIGDVCPTRAHHARRPEITGSGIKVKKADRFEPWIRVHVQPEEQQKMIMMKEALRIALMIVMKNHTYEFNQVIRKQADGGPIGMDLTGTIAKIYMKWWDKQLIRKMDAIGKKMELYERYVDDISICIKAIEIGARYVGGELIYTQESKDEDEDIHADKRTFKVIQEVGNSIHPSVQLEIDVPSNYEDGRLPILDLKVWIGIVATENGLERKIIHEHYMKIMANKYVISKDAAMSLQNKRRILTQMCLRVFLNNSEYLEWEENKKRVEYFMKRMQASGYSEQFRYEVLKSAIHAYDEIKNNSERPIYRGKEWNTPQQRKKRKEKRNNWFRRGGNESVLFVPTTPQSGLRKLVEEEVAQSKIKIKVVERPGMKVKRLLQRNDPFKKKQCSDDMCFVCSTTKKGNCRRTGITYAIKCNGNCDGNIYNGETHANGYTRGMEHQSDYQFKRADSMMWKHCLKKHEGIEQEFEMKVVDYIRGDPTKRQILEAVHINEIPEAKRINDRKEWIIGKIPTVTVTQ